DPAARPLVGVEVKTGANARKLGQTPYHTLKLASMRRLHGVEATYLVVAATTQSFSGNEPGAELFKTPVGRSEEWYSSYFLEEWGHAWAQSLGDDSGKAMHLPRTLRLQLVCIQQVPAFADWEIRVLRVENPTPRASIMFRWDKRLTHLDADPFENGPPQIRDAFLTTDHVPRPRRDQPDLQLFALSCNGYAREGNQANCARLADEARRRWEQITKIPDGLRALRSCLFYEQRRARKSGHGFADGHRETLPYVRALVEGIRQQL